MKSNWMPQDLIALTLAATVLGVRDAARPTQESKRANVPARLSDAV